jgi:hypothetical protein
LWWSHELESFWVLLGWGGAIQFTYTCASTCFYAISRSFLCFAYVFRATQPSNFRHGHKERQRETKREGDNFHVKHNVTKSIINHQYCHGFVQIFMIKMIQTPVAKGASLRTTKAEASPRKSLRNSSTWWGPSLFGGPAGLGVLQALDDGSMTIMTQQRCISLGRLGKERGWIYRIMNNVNMESRFCKDGSDWIGRFLSMGW